MSFIGALCEAAMLVLLTNAALAISGGQGFVQVRDWEIPAAQLLIAVAVLLGIRLGLALLGVRLAAGLSMRLLVDQRHRLANAYLRASWQVQQQQPAGRLQEYLSTIVGTAVLAVGALSGWLASALSLIAFLGTALVVDAVSTALVIVAMVVLSALLGPLRRTIRGRAIERASTGLAFTSSVAELSALGLEMQVFGVQSRFSDRISRLSDANGRAHYRTGVVSGALAPTYITMAYAAVIGGVAILSVRGAGELSAVGAVLLLMLRALAYGQNLQTSSGTIASSLPYVTRVHTTIEEFQSAAASGGQKQPQAVAPLAIDHVSFTYDGERAALANVSFHIDPHEYVGVIGPSGSGKSTLVQLLLGLRDPSSGTVLAAGYDLGDVDRSWWTKRVAVVAQDALLFTGTVAENIRFFRDGISDEAIRRSASQAHLLAEIESLPSGFDTHLGERGSQLSGGQRQRLSIARALAGEPELIIMDEPTSALDTRSEGLIRATLTELRGRVTVVIIAHRMSTLDICDRILVIEDGQLTAIDTPGRLYQRSEFYRNALAMSGIASPTGDTPSAP